MKLDTREIELGRYRHYKGGEYNVIGTAYHSETQELMVLYQPLYGEQKLWVRPYDMFSESVQVNECTTQRFVRIDD